MHRTDTVPRSSVDTNVFREIFGGGKYMKVHLLSKFFAEGRKEGEREREKKTLLIKANDVRNKLCTKRWMVDKDRGRKLRKR